MKKIITKTQRNLIFWATLFSIEKKSDIKKKLQNPNWSYTHYCLKTSSERRRQNEERN
jgi:hypothetical protein